MLKGKFILSSNDASYKQFLFDYLGISTSTFCYTNLICICNGLEEWHKVGLNCMSFRSDHVNQNEEHQSDSAQKPMINKNILKKYTKIKAHDYLSNYLLPIGSD